MTLLLALFSAMLLMAWQRHLHLGRYRVVRTRRKGWLTVELRYRDFLIAPIKRRFLNRGKSGWWCGDCWAAWCMCAAAVWPCPASATPASTTSASAILTPALKTTFA